MQIDIEDWFIFSKTFLLCVIYAGHFVVTDAKNSLGTLFFFSLFVHLKKIYSNISVSFYVVKYFLLSNYFYKLFHSIFKKSWIAWHWGKLFKFLFLSEAKIQCSMSQFMPKIVTPLETKCITQSDFLNILIIFIELYRNVTFFLLMLFFICLQHYYQLFLFVCLNKLKRSWSTNIIQNIDE